MRLECYFSTLAPFHFTIFCVRAGLIQPPIHPAVLTHIHLVFLCGDVSQKKNAKTILRSNSCSSKYDLNYCWILLHVRKSPALKILVSAADRWLLGAL